MRKLADFKDDNFQDVFSIVPKITLIVRVWYDREVYTDAKRKTVTLKAKYGKDYILSVKMLPGETVIVTQPERKPICYVCEKKEMRTKKNAICIEADAVDHLGIPFRVVKVKHNAVGVPIVFGRYQGEKLAYGRIIITQQLANYLRLGLSNREVGSNLDIEPITVSKLKSALGIQKAKSNQVWQSAERLYDLLTMPVEHLCIKYNISPVSVHTACKRNLKHSHGPKNWFMSTYYRDKLMAKQPITVIATDMKISTLAVEVLIKRIEELQVQNYDEDW